ncbi:DUF4762 family protein [Serratia marcescens]|jgi:hypothetical protein|uniref:DUF4762 family protein n=1 Tax=Serratia marcescens TaxID=615 RepID=UPI0018D5F1EB|nr:DUF4762 family protein [Serratia marcescens]ELQ9311580.1 DUF4762 family protein [Serratia marcescens]ELQ9441667.1 DUF4762 family protein [Serratia marcescens]ELT5561016.1 DUF4762 family protein [Serratia marcescens]MBH2584398.1 DUF4762 family protein [Serratia marcescens]CAI1772638.1 Uncharacterised protein [Serratia marcescens]
MKKINLSEAGNIVGGTFFCANEFAWVGSGNNRVCNRVKTCTDKFGGVQKFYYPAPVASCPSNPSTPNAA